MLIIISKRRLDELEREVKLVGESVFNALATGYRLGWQMGQIEVRNRALIGQLSEDYQPQSFVDKQVETILWKEEERNGEL